MNTFQPVVGQRTDRGRTRPRNEDAVSGPPPDLDPNLIERKGYLYAVADGMGGEAGGQQASTIAMQTLVTEYYRDPEPDVTRSLWRAVRAANQSVYHEARRNPALARMGTTLTAAVVQGEDLVVAHVGDSRAYLIRNNDILQLTRDHSWVADAVRTGTLSAKEAQTHPNRNILTRALGSELEVEVDVVREKLRPGDRVLLCSDGLTNLVGDGDILQRVQKSGPQQAADALIDLANERGGHDNITAMVIVAGGRGAARRVPPRAAAPRPSGVPWPVVGGMLAIMAVAVMVFWTVINKPLDEQAIATQTAVAQTVTQIAAVEATQTEVAAATETAVAQPTATEEAAPTATPAEPPTATPTEVPTATPTAMPTPTHTEEPTRTPTETLTPTPTLTATPTPTTTPPPPTPTATSTATQTAIPVPTGITLSEPANGADVSGLVTFSWEWSEQLEEGEVFDVKVCQGGGCPPESGKTNTDQKTWDWCPDTGEGVYRWKVEIIDNTTKQPKGPTSKIWEFTWTGSRREVCDKCPDPITGGKVNCNCRIECH